VSWETRQRGTRYYTRTHRVNGRQVREYIGGGIVGVLAEWEDEQARQERERQRAVWRQEQAKLRVSEEPTKTLGAICAKLVGVTLLEAGFYNHKGEWRKLHG
jgi:hypothetical protein